MRRQAAASIWSLSSCSGSRVNGQRLPLAQIGKRWMEIYATPTSSGPTVNQLDINTQKPASQPDARFEVLGAPFSLLSVQLSASQNLLTRRGTLVALSGKPDSVVSRLSLLSPFSRTIGGIPFLYQSITSTTPITALISTKSPFTSFAVVHLDGRLDWIISQRDGLLAWTGQSLSVSPKLNYKLRISHWGNSHVTGRGLLALVGKGQMYQISLKPGEEYVVHPSNVVAYSMNQNPPQPYRFKSTTLKLQVPSIMSWLPDTRFTREARKTSTWKFLANLFFTLRTWTRRTIWGDRLFLHFRGPTTILLQTRASRLSDSLTTRDVNEIADAPAGEVSKAITLDLRKEGGHESSITETPRTAPSKKPPEGKPVKMTYVTVGVDKKVRFQGP